MKKQLLTLTLGAALVAPAYGQNVQELAQQGIQALGGVENIQKTADLLKEQINDKVAPVTKELARKIYDGKFDTLGTYLKDNVDKLDIALAIDYLVAQMGDIKQLIEQSLDYIPHSYSFPIIEEAKKQVRDHLYLFDTIREELPKLKTIKASEYVDTIVSALKSIADSNEYASLKPKLEDFYGNNIEPLVAKINDTDFEKIELAAKEGLKKLNNEDFNLTDIINGLGEARRLAPALVGLPEKVINLLLEINTTLIEAQSHLPADSQQYIPSDISETMLLIRDNTKTIHDDINNLNDYIDQIKESQN